ncbi:zinc finger protein 324A-like [Myripristis murdjan]|uniref:zinc finger protein 324A-like n=1 Tax=Myripristis murdjan TaxID=586833 RepID=UPI0011761B8E|nr:zinc finger protein 324A-like [Myripristis murdjan]
MSAEELLFPAGLEPLSGLETHSKPPEMETLRVFVNERLAAAVDDILAVFGRTVARYREEIDRQRRQLDGLGPDTKWHLADPLQPSWMEGGPTDEQLLCLQLDQRRSGDEAEAGGSTTHIKTEAEGEPAANFDPAGGLEAASDVQLLSDRSDTEDSDEYWKEARRPARPRAGGAKGPKSLTGKKSKSLSELSQEQKPSGGLPRHCCQVCGESFQKRSHLMTHAPAHVHDCGLCGKHLDDSESLKPHLRAHQERSFRCGVCGQTFTLRGNLRTHLRIHSGERPYGCTVCGKSFGRRATLVRHVRSHTGEKPFVCSYCGRGFVEKGNLTVHLRTHTGERPYWCSVCDRRFSQLSCFYKHPCQRKRLMS